MDDDYARRVARGEMYVTGEDAIEGVLVLLAHDGYLMIENVAVEPRFQGRGIGRGLMAFAEEHARALALRPARLGELHELEIERQRAVLMRKRLE